MFRSLIKAQLPRVSSGRRAISPAIFNPVLSNSLQFQKPQGVRFYSGFPELTREIARERIIELLEGYEKIADSGKELKEEASFIQDLGLDSLDVVEVVMELEHEFNIQIPDHEADSLKTVGQTIDYILAQPDAC
ncbi:mitochondrial acyl carrier protein [Yamadazyma tenuis]|uniref:Acyl carrier protein n=1 Tax=Candida tenuis (strain ATCC 10573 / BCRC 21748 / CBS 615 / JCM 9827 / NBRC 10315 / NRRL Y-1498 / VKM Y-70) TaxID=590646 RepID=G3B638_CANTC|nr:acyl carrier protein [Yamadazyma tenuis ATCC 10573]EGV63371.1 acyl carrier protein [Yamadazyma tenuis ATCC 10573]WEJ96802.1 mitochondrial acyl carrier protein [Yamadazyma tenuis]